MASTRGMIALMATAVAAACAARPVATPDGHAPVTLVYDVAALTTAQHSGDADAACAELARRLGEQGFPVLDVARDGALRVRVGVPLAQKIRGPRDVAGLALWPSPTSLTPDQVHALEAQLAAEMDRRRAAGEVVSSLTDVNAWLPLPATADTVCCWLPVDPVQGRLMQERGWGHMPMDPWFVLVEAPRNPDGWWTGPVFRSLELQDNLQGRPAVAFRMAPAAAARFHDLTAKLIDRPLYVAVDGRVLSAPRVLAPIQGNGILEGGPDGLTLEDQAAVLGSLPGRRAPVATALTAVEWGE